jgi:hypothetical protein
MNVLKAVKKALMPADEANPGDEALLAEVKDLLKVVETPPFVERATTGERLSERLSDLRSDFRRLSSRGRNDWAALGASCSRAAADAGERVRQLQSEISRDSARLKEAGEEGAKRLSALQAAIAARSKLATDKRAGVEALEGERRRAITDAAIAGLEPTGGTKAEAELTKARIDADRAANDVQTLEEALVRLRADVDASAQAGAASLEGLRQAQSAAVRDGQGARWDAAVNDLLKAAIEAPALNFAELRVPVVDPERVFGGDTLYELTTSGTLEAYVPDLRAMVTVGTWAEWREKVMSLKADLESIATRREADLRRRVDESKGGLEIVDGRLVQVGRQGRLSLNATTVRGS